MRIFAVKRKTTAPFLVDINPTAVRRVWSGCEQGAKHSNNNNLGKWVVFCHEAAVELFDGVLGWLFELGVFHLQVVKQLLRQL